MKMRIVLLLCAMVFSQPTFLPVSAGAATASDCSLYLDSLAKDLETNTTVLDDLASPNSPSPDHVAQSASRYNRDVDRLQSCSSSKRSYVDALLATWNAWLEHATTHTNPIDRAALAASRLKKCAAAYAGTNDGATCTTWETQLAKWQDEWGLP
jgi:hypothetical protein